MSVSPTRGPQYPIASVDNVLRLILMLRDRPQLRVADAADALGVAHSTAHRLLAMLAQHGFVRQDLHSKWYVAGDTLVDVGLAAVRNLDVRRIARPLLERLSLETGETVHAGVLDDSTVRYVDAIESSHVLRVTGRTGMALPAHCSSLGKAMLAEITPERLRELYANHQLVQLTDRSIGSFDDLAALIDQVRRQGYAVNLEEAEAGVGSVAVAVPTDLGPNKLLAIGCSAPVARLSASRIEQIAEMTIRLNAAPNRCLQML